MRNYKRRPPKIFWWAVLGNEACGLYDSELLAQQSTCLVTAGEYHRFDSRAEAKRYLVEKLLMMGVICSVINEVLLRRSNRLYLIPLIRSATGG